MNLLNPKRRPRRDIPSGGGTVVNPAPSSWASQKTPKQTVRDIGPSLYRIGSAKVGSSVAGVVLKEAARRVAVVKAAVTAPVPQVRIAAGNVVDASYIPNTIKSGSLSPLATTSKNTSNVTFSGIRVRLWSREKDGPLDQFLASKDLTTEQIKALSVGRYVLGFKIPYESNIPFVAFDSPYPIKVLGKTVLLEKGRLDQSTGRMELQINLLENPIPVMALIVGIGGALAAGVLGFGLSDMFDSLDRVVVDMPGSLMQVAVIVGIGYILYRYVL